MTYKITTISLFFIALLAIGSEAQADPLKHKWSVSHDCESWVDLPADLHVDDPGALEAALAKIKNKNLYEDFSFVKLNVEDPVLGGASILAVGSNPRDLVVLHEDGDIVWLINQGDTLVEIGSDNILTSTPVINRPEDPSMADKSAAAIAVIKGMNASNEIFMAPGQDGVQFVQKRGDIVWGCFENKACTLAKQDVGKIEDPAQLQEARKLLDKNELQKNLGASCELVLDQENKMRLDAYDVLAGSCGGKMDMNNLKTGYDVIAAGCKAYLEKIVPRTDAFFAEGVVSQP